MTRVAVGPVLKSGRGSRALVAALLQLNPEAHVEDRGSYLRVLAPGRCVLTREAAEAELGHAFRLPLDLEPLLLASKGVFVCNEERAEWALDAP